MHKEIEIQNRIRERIDELNSKRPKEAQLTPQIVAEAAGVTADFIYKLMRGERSCSQEVQFAIVHVLESTAEDIFMPLKKT